MSLSNSDYKLYLIHVYSFPLLDQTPIDTEQSRGLTFPNAGVGLRAFCLWKGKLLVKGGSFCNVEMRTDNDSAGNKAFL